jgi:hypothetical protein
MPSKNNLNWINLDPSFKLNQTIEVKEDTIDVDYVVFNEKNEIIIFGFDLSDDTVTDIGIMKFLYNEKPNIEKDSILYKMFNVIENGSNPFVFLATNNKVFYLPNGIRQINPDVWETIDHPNELIKLCDNPNK